MINQKELDFLNLKHVFLQINSKFYFQNQYFSIHLIVVFIGDFSMVVIILLSLAAIIIIAAVFFRGFQDKIFGHNEGQAEIAGILTVRGATFLILVLSLAGLSVFLEIKEAKQPSRKEAIEILKGEQPDSFELAYQSEDSIYIKLDNEKIGKLKGKFEFDIFKSDQAPNKYDLHVEKAPIGNIDLNMYENTMLFENGNIYYQDSSYNIPNTDFWFMIDEIRTINYNEKKITRYVLMFGEGLNKKRIIWTDKTFEYGKSDDGKIPNQMKLISQPKWGHSYALALGLGNFGGNNGINHVEIINAMLVRIKLVKN